MYRSDEQLLRACRQGDDSAWEELLDKYERLVFSIPLNYGLSHEDAADITQLTFTIFLQSVAELRPDSRLGPWLATVARRHTWRLLARNRRESPVQEGDLSEVLPLIDQSNRRRQERWELLEWLHHGLNLIGARCRKLLTALYFDPQEPSYTDVAQQLEMPVGSIGPTRARCLKRLRDVLREVLD